ncbi:MAG: EipB family protein [Candidatus Puniceispirillaceae bacterium]
MSDLYRHIRRVDRTMKEGDAMHRQVLYVLPILIAGTAQAAAIPELSTHQARYEMDLLSATQDSQMTSIKGKVKFEIKNDCNGWISSEDYLLEFGYGSGDSAIIVSHFESWEDKTGNLYSFEVHEGSSYEPEKQFMGYASRNVAAAGNEAFNSLAPDSVASLPDDVYFPVLHTRSILERAEKGEKLFSANIFFGAEPDKSLKRTSTVIGTLQKIDDPKLSDMLEMKSYYPVQVAYFDPASTQLTPDYEITFHMQPNGVIPYYEVDYGDFSLKASMTEIELLPTPDCS